MRIAILCLLLLAGCERASEELQRGPVGSASYIAPRFVEVEIIQYNPFESIKLSSGTMYRKEHCVVQSEEGKRYTVLGKVGEVGDKFQMDVSLRKPIGSE